MTAVVGSEKKKRGRVRLPDSVIALFFIFFHSQLMLRAFFPMIVLLTCYLSSSYMPFPSSYVHCRSNCLKASPVCQTLSTHFPNLVNLKMAPLKKRNMTVGGCYLTNRSLQNAAKTPSHGSY